MSSPENQLLTQLDVGEDADGPNELRTAADVQPTNRITRLVAAVDDAFDFTGQSLNRCGHVVLALGSLNMSFLPR